MCVTASGRLSLEEELPDAYPYSSLPMAGALWRWGRGWGQGTREGSISTRNTCRTLLVVAHPRQPQRSTSHPWRCARSFYGFSWAHSPPCSGRLPHAWQCFRVWEAQLLQPSACCPGRPPPASPRCRVRGTQLLLLCTWCTGHCAHLHGFRGCQLRGPANTETTPQGTPAAAVVRKHRPDAARSTAKGRTGGCPGSRKEMSQPDKMLHRGCLWRRWAWTD